MLVGFRESPELQNGGLRTLHDGRTLINCAENYSSPIYIYPGSPVFGRYWCSPASSGCFLPVRTTPEPPILARLRSVATRAHQRVQDASGIAPPLPPSASVSVRLVCFISGLPGPVRAPASTERYVLLRFTDSPGLQNGGLRDLDGAL